MKQTSIVIPLAAAALILCSATNAIAQERNVGNRAAEPSKASAPLQQASAAQHRAAGSAVSNAISLEGKFLTIPAGQFRMGDSSGEGNDDEKPLRMVQIKAFRIGQFEVTRQQFSTFTQATGYQTDAERNATHAGCNMMNLSNGEWRYRSGLNWRNPGFAQSDNHPVTCVSWNDTQAYIAWLNQQTGLRLRLPSEAEWEYAARAGSLAKFPWGTNPHQGCNYANGADRTPWPGNKQRWPQKMECNDRYFFTAPVGSYAPNAFGVADMIGNVWEWTQDCYHNSYAGAPNDGSARILRSCSTRVYRGGSCCSGPPHLRVSFRLSDPPTTRGQNLGFRLAID